MQRAGLTEIGAVDFDPEAIAVFRSNFPQMRNLFERNIKHFAPSQLARLIGVGKADVIVGGPPCQGFSRVRQIDGTNSGARFVEDERRDLYRNFLKYVDYFQPKIFVLENVLGVRSAASGEYFTRIQSEARRLGYRVHGEVIRAWQYGVPQKRERQFVIGTRVDLPIFSVQLYMPPTHTFLGQAHVDGHNGDAVGERQKLQNIVTLWEAIGDLPPLGPGEGVQESQYDLERRSRHLERYGKRYLSDVIELVDSELLTAHVARPHSERDLRDFARLREGETSVQAIGRGVRMEFPYDRDSFKDRFTKQRRNGLCSTICAHLSKDGLMFIHPTQNRSLTPREAARVQSFPDWFQFPVPRTNQFRFIGNAVPPLVSELLGQAILRWLRAEERINSGPHQKLVPSDLSEAISKTLQLVEAAKKDNLANVPPLKFKQGWFAICFMYAQLHPDSIQENGKHVRRVNKGIALIKQLAPHLVSPIYEQSGWPVSLVDVVMDARRRHSCGELKHTEYYCSEAQIAGNQWFKKNGHSNEA